jgi:fructokinase
MRYDVTALGEVVIDLIPTPASKNLAYVASPGGAPANVAAGVARLGLKSAMISKVGQDPLGRAAVEALAEAGVATHDVKSTPDQNTALAVVSRLETGEAHYTLYRENSSDANLRAEEIPDQLISNSLVLHVGTLLLATPISAAAQRRAMALARVSGIAVSTDVNFRAAFWQDRAAMRSAGLEMVSAANVVKTSRDELALMAERSDVAAGVHSLWHAGLVAFAVTDGPAGAELFTPDDTVSLPAFQVEAVDTVGCGDAYMASLLAGLIAGRMTPPRGDTLMTVAKRACAAGAIMAMRRGALEHMPTSVEIDAFLAKQMRG